MDILRTALTNLGLSSEEVTIYLASLEDGSTTALSLARGTGIPRTTVYLLIESLIDKELISEHMIGTKKAFIPAPPEDLLILAEKKKDLMQQTMSSIRSELPQLQAVYNNSHRKPRMKYYEGREEVKKLFEETLKADKIYLHFTSQQAVPVMDGFMESYRERVMQSMIPTQEIVTDSDGDLAYQKDYSTARNTIISLPEKFATHVDFMIYGQKVVYISYKEESPSGILIEDADIAHFERTRFIMLWESLRGEEYSDSNS